MRSVMPMMPDPLLAKTDADPAMGLRISINAASPLSAETMTLTG
jgi:hypothetical protein